MLRVIQRGGGNKLEEMDIRGKQRMPTTEIKKFYSDPACSICHRQVRGWARAFCDNCGRPVCRKHRPLFVQYWQCPACAQAQKAFIQQPSVAPAASDPQSEQSMIQTAGVHLQSGREAEAQNLIDQIFVELFEKR
jgi:hypothetical protein